MAKKQATKNQEPSQKTGQPLPEMTRRVEGGRMIFKVGETDVCWISAKTFYDMLGLASSVDPTQVLDEEHAIDIKTLVGFKRLLLKGLNLAQIGIAENIPDDEMRRLWGQNRNRFSINQIEAEMIRQRAEPGEKDFVKADPRAAPSGHTVEGYKTPSLVMIKRFLDQGDLPSEISARWSLNDKDFEEYVKANRKYINSVR